ncbi:hypothetical protein CYLTODRAFT_472029 [Cylindrobasidium torrendii FP15055 ss-10]|uniref:DDE-1 domain-containing protein n=1 Tax=Cylindrobasidium torrendii FP15055 ss-10 TaxID=1314674 RepID=A0A0D7B1U9_9AGAR|nr:hypothetical protein CYLTODRAFT_358876 [Cylindrobasidium torrendii FP15055 ss-10]KIY71164.1 hypothetical protein CYLTODRAFT_472029 [Cylindrobasidium torrendii FP15055 ss-10]
MPKGRSTKPPRPSNGPPQQLIGRIDYLRDLFCGLPSTLPDNPHAYPISINLERLEEGGSFAALGHALEITFKTWANPDIMLRERGSGLEELIQIIKQHFKKMSPSEQEAFNDTWLTRLIVAAKNAGARKMAKRKADVATCTDEDSLSDIAQVPSKRRYIILDSDDDSECPPLPAPSARGIEAEPIVLDDADSDMPGISSASSIPPLPFPPPLPSFKPTPSPLVPKLGLASTRQTTLGAWRQPESKEDKDARLKREFSLIADRRDDEFARQVDRKQAKIEKERQQAADRQRRKRERDRAQRADVGEDELVSVNDALRHGAQAGAATRRAVAELGVDVVAASRPGRDWRAQRNGKNGGAVQGRAKYTNYYHPLLWAWIVAAVIQADWSSAKAARILKDNPVSHALFPHLDKGRIHKWMKRGRKEWTEETLANVKKGRAVNGQGRAGVLDVHPEVKTEILRVLKSYRASKIPILPPLARATMLAIIEVRAPEILTARFKCSERFTRQFLESNLNWAIRKGTRAAAHIPGNWEDQCEATIFRLVYVLKWQGGCKKLLINMDQQGMFILPNTSSTLEEAGSRQVDVQAKDEKRAFTVCVSSTADGDFLPFQSVWGGQSARSLPSESAAGMQEAKAYGFDFTFAKSETSKRSHFSTLKTMREYVENIVVPWRDAVLAADPTIPRDHPAILLIDAYPVHLSKNFRTFIFDNHPEIILIYIPANCTGVFQPADVGLQRVIKHQLKQELFEFMIGEQRKQVAQGVRPEDFKVPSGIGELRDASVRGLVKVYEFMQTKPGHSLVKKAWQKCSANGLNLSGDCLTSPDTQKLLAQYLRAHQELHDEIFQRVGVVHVDKLPEDPVDSPDRALVAEELSQLDEMQDDVDVPLHAIVQEALGVELGTEFTQTTQYLSHREAVRFDGGFGAVDTNEEDLMAYDNDGILIPTIS